MAFLNEITTIETDYDKAIYLQNLLIERATGGSPTNEDYTHLRSYFLRSTSIKPLIPKWMQNCRDLNQFWSFIKNEFGTYEARRSYIRKQFSFLLDHLEYNSNELPYNAVLNSKINYLDSQYINDSWQKIINRKNTDFEGAITSARTLLESVLKAILDDMGQNTHNDGDLNKLYKEVSTTLKLSPNNHNEQVFRQILGGCASVVNGLSSLRNEYGDSHGKGRIAYKPARRHTDLAINMACSVSLFLIQTYEHYKEGI